MTTRASALAGTQRSAIAARMLNALAIGIVFTLLLTPVVMIIWASFIDSVFISFPPPGYTLRWFSAAARNTAFFSGFMTSFKVAAIAAALGVVIATAASLALVRGQFPGRAALNSLLLSPLMVPNIVLGTALYVFYIAVSDSTGLELTRGIAGLVAAHLLLTVPWSIRLISANLIGIDRSIEEAAANLGANPLRTFLSITLPQMRSGVIAAALFSFIISFENLELSLLLVEPGATTLPIAIMQYLEFNMDPTIAAVSTAQIVIIAALLVITDRFVKLSRVV
jgi:putative spermidine/putrescine transport system permease protein